MDTEEHVERMLRARDTGTTVDPDPALDVARAYAVAAGLEARYAGRGRTRVGRKIGFTNRAVWEQFGLDRPIWAPVFDATVTRSPVLDVTGLPNPRLEPEVVLGLGADLGPGDEPVIAWAAIGVEIVASHHGGDGRLRPADAVADLGIHARLLVGPVLELGDDPASTLRGLVVTLTGPDGTPVTGRGDVVLGGPVEALVALAGLPGAAPVRAGEIVTTGTLVPPPWIAPGQEWTVAVQAGPTVTVRT